MKNKNVLKQFGFAKLLLRGLKFWKKVLIFDLKAIKVTSFLKVVITKINIEMNDSCERVKKKKSLFLQNRWYL